MQMHVCLQCIMQILQRLTWEQSCQIWKEKLGLAPMLISTIAFIESLECYVKFGAVVATEE